MKEIISRYKAGEITLEEANAQLKEAGAGFYLTGDKRAGWTESQLEQDFFDLPEEAKARKEGGWPDKPDMGRRVELAGLTVVQNTAAGRFAVGYDESGYCTGAQRL